jgi:hypothetical protein
MIFLTTVPDLSQEERFFFLFPQKIKKKGVKQKEDVVPLVWTARGGWREPPVQG